MVDIMEILPLPLDDEGTKTFNVDIAGEDKILRTFTFFIEVKK